MFLTTENLNSKWFQFYLSLLCMLGILSHCSDSQQIITPLIIVFKQQLSNFVECGGWISENVALMYSCVNFICYIIERSLNFFL